MVNKRKTTPADGAETAENLSAFVALPATLTVETAEAVLADWNALALHDARPLVLDALQVESITTPGLQLLLALEKTLAVQGGSFVMQHLRENLADVFKDAGLASLLQHTHSINQGA